MVLKSFNPHIAHFCWEGGGENRDTISVDIFERLVLDGFTLKQDAYRRVSAKDKGLVETKELTLVYVNLIDRIR